MLVIRPRTSAPRGMTSTPFGQTGSSRTATKRLTDLVGFAVDAVDHPDEIFEPVGIVIRRVCRSCRMSDALPVPCPDAGLGSNSWLRLKQWYSRFPQALAARGTRVVAGAAVVFVAELDLLDD